MDLSVVAPADAEQLSDSQRAFLRLGAIFVAVGILSSALAFYLIDASIDGQHANIALLERENSNLDAQIKEIASLESDMKVLRDRQKAVESLQAMRNAPVRMMSALVQSTPETVVLSALTQAGTRLTITGLAGSNGDIAQFLRNLDAMPTQFERPELVESLASDKGAQTGAGRTALTFSIRVDLAAVTPPIPEKPQ
jgi:type IV pilus assembly protein PilN